MPIMCLYFFRSKLSIYLQIYVKNGYIFKTSTQIFFSSTQCIILFIFLWFSQIKIGGGALCAPHIITKVYLPLIITKVNIEPWFSLNTTFQISVQICSHSIFHHILSGVIIKKECLKCFVWFIKIHNWTWREKRRL